MQNFYWAVRLGPIPVNREGGGIGQKEKLISNVGAIEASVDLLRGSGAEMALQNCSGCRQMLRCLFFHVDLS